MPHFTFSPDNLTRAEAIIARYPDGRQQSAVMPLLDLAQRQNHGHLSKEAMDAVAEMLGMPYIRVYEVATFYTMYNLKKPGTHLVEVCTNLPCWLRGSDGVVKACRKTLGVEMGETTEDGAFTLKQAECLGACVNAPMMQITTFDGRADNHIRYFEDLDENSATKVLEALKDSKDPKPGPQINRHASAPAGGLTTLKDSEAA